jgi:hypothetical protein
MLEHWTHFKNKNILLFITFCGAIILYHFFCYTGHFGYDDMEYSKLSVELLRGHFDSSNHFSFRFPIIILTALSYKVFGINDFAGSIPPLIISCSILWIVYLSLKNASNAVLIAGLGLCCFSNWFTFYTDKLMPDIYVAFSVSLAIYILHQYRFHSQKNTILYSISLCGTLLFGFMAKETIVLTLPLFLYFCIKDLLQKRHLKFWISNVAIGIILLILYFSVIWYITGDFNKRFTTIDSNNYLNSCSYGKQSLEILLKRISIDFYSLMISQSMFIAFILILGAIIHNGIKQLFKIDDSLNFYILSSCLLVISANFMSISISSYNPMCLDPRHYLYLIPVTAIPAAHIFNSLLQERKLNIILILLTLLSILIAYLFETDATILHYIPILILFLISLVKTSRTTQYFITMSIILALILAIKPFTSYRYAKQVKFDRQSEIIHNFIKTLGNNNLIISNPVQTRFNDYLNEYGRVTNNIFINYDDSKKDSISHLNKYLIKNPHTEYLSHISENDIPYYVKNLNPSSKLILQDEFTNIKIYKLADQFDPERDGTIILKSFNDFEKDYPYWNNYDSRSVEIKPYEGDSCAKVIEFSPTFSLELNTLKLDSFESIYIYTSLYCNYDNSTNSKLAISLETKDGNYKWEGLEINKYLKAYSNWWKVSNTLLMPKNEIKQNSKLSIYLWNIDKKNAYIDNFEVKIFGIIKSK